MPTSQPSAPSAAEVPAAPDSTPVPGLPPTTPDWVIPVMRRVIWRFVLTVLGVVVLLVMVDRARSVITMIVIALFFGIAMEPAVNRLHRKHGWPRGLATALVFVALGGFLVALTFILIPGLVSVADQLRDAALKAIPTINRDFGTTLPTSPTDPQWVQAQESVKKWITSHASDIAGVASSTIGLVFQFFTVAMFAFYFAADAPKIRRAVLRKLPPAQQQRLGWSWDTAIEQTGGYFYSRIILMVINGGLFFFAMLLVGVDWTLALPLAIFEGFVAEFIPAIGTYLGAAVPILIVLATLGLTPAIILVVWVLIYQQAENYWLSPRISSKTMEINGGVAFGSALAGGAIAGPMGAFMALPVAALITSFLKNYGRKYALVYHSPYDGEYRDAQEDAEQAAATAEAAEQDTGQEFSPAEVAAPGAAADIAGGGGPAPLPSDTTREV